MRSDVRIECNDSWCRVILQCHAEEALCRGYIASFTQQEIHRQCTVAVAHVNVLFFGVEAEVVCVVPERDGFKRLIINAVEEPQCSVIPIRHVKPFNVRQIQHALGFAQVGDGMDPLPSLMSITSMVLLPRAATNNRPVFTSSDM